jgi:threonine dehydratase
MQLLADCSVSIKDIYHERAWVDTDIASVRVKCIVETADRSNAIAMFDALRNAGYEVRSTCATRVFAWRRPPSV